MRIGLIDVDGHNFPNLALMKISAYHKRQGDCVEWADIGKYARTYVSKIFTFSPDYSFGLGTYGEVTKGGTGYDITAKLPADIEAINAPDYSIYPKYNFSIQFYSRGCIRNCPFCVVRQKEGMIHPVEPMDLNPNGKYIEVLDNNFFANPEWMGAVQHLITQQQPINLHGVDVRIMNEEQAYWLNKLRICGSIHIAWDNPAEDILPRIVDMIKYIKPYKITCYVLIGFNSTIEQDYERVIKLKELGVMPFVQPYRDFQNTRIPNQYEKDFASWANKRERLKAFDFKDFRPRKGFKCSEYFKVGL